MYIYIHIDIYIYMYIHIHIYIDVGEKACERLCVGVWWGGGRTRMYVSIYILMYACVPPCMACERYQRLFAFWSNRLPHQHLALHHHVDQRPELKFVWRLLPRNIGDIGRIFGDHVRRQSLRRFCLLRLGPFASARLHLSPDIVKRRSKDLGKARRHVTHRSRGKFLLKQCAHTLSTHFVLVLLRQRENDGLHLLHFLVPAQAAAAAGGGREDRTASSA